MVEKNSLRIAFIGAGRVAQHYKKIFKSGILSKFEIVGVCDVELKAAKALADEWNSRAFIDIHEMITNTKPDLALVLTPSGSHYLHTKLCLELDINVLVEKPVSMITGQAEELEKIARNKGLMLCVAFQNRFNPSIKALKQAIDLNRFGRITTATIRLRWCRFQSYYEDGWHGTWLNDGGVINQQAIHHVDALNWLLGPIESVCSIHTKRLNKLEAEDTLVALVKFSCGALGTIEATTAARPIDLEASISVLGENGVAVIGGIALNKIETWNFVKSQKEDENIPINCSQDVPNGYGLSHGCLLKAIIDKLLSKSSEAPISVDDCIGTTKLIHALYRSSELGQWVQLVDNPISQKLGRN